MPQTGICTDLTCNKELTELYECHCCTWLLCLKHLLEHVEVAKRDKDEQKTILRDEVISVSYTLELIVEKKIHEIEHEKELIIRAKQMLDTPECSMKALQEIFGEINLAIVSNRKEETIVKVESSLSDIKTCSCDNEVSNIKMEMFDLTSPSRNSHSQAKSPTYRAVRFHANRLENSTISRNNDHSMETHYGSNNIILDDLTLDLPKDEADDEEAGQENSIRTSDVLLQCPFTFNGAFGVTTTKHGIELCSKDKSFKRTLMGHLKSAHRLKHGHARRVIQAIRFGLDPQQTKLFSENEVIIDFDRRISCPFSSSMINLIGCCPTQSRKVPCQTESVAYRLLGLHLRQHHQLSANMAKKINYMYKVKLSKMISLNVSEASSSY